MFRALLGIFFLSLSPLVFGKDALELQIDHYPGAGISIKVNVEKQSEVLITDEDDDIYIFNEDEYGYKYYMIGTGMGRRENLWAGVGHAEYNDTDYMKIDIKNLKTQYGQDFCKNLVLNTTFNGVKKPGIVEDWGFGLYPERIITDHGIPGIKEVRLRATYFELGTNHLAIKLILENGAFDLLGYDHNNLAVFGDGKISTRLFFKN